MRRISKRIVSHHCFCRPILIWSLVAVSRMTSWFALFFTKLCLSKISLITKTCLRITEAERAIPNKVLEMGEVPPRRALGVRWDPQTDTFGFAFAHIDRPPRSIFKWLAGLYDPLGWASPYIVHAKVMMQRLWSRGLDWDDLLPPDMSIEWNKWEKEMNALKSLCIVSLARFGRNNYLCSAMRRSMPAWPLPTCMLRLQIWRLRVTLSSSRPVSCHWDQSPYREENLWPASWQTASGQLELSMLKVMYLSDSPTAL